MSVLVDWNHTFPDKPCKKCKLSFTPANGKQKYCGSYRRKEGCSYLIVRARSKKWGARPQAKEYAARYYQRYKPLIHERRHQNYLSTLPSRIASWTKRHAIQRNAPGSFTASEWLNLKALYDYRCAYCFVPESLTRLTIDHKIPLSQGGTNNIDNLQPLCQPCNSSKGTRTWFANYPLILSYAFNS
jgi:5-methylcytosine-specific restriction endonuclease McrA